MDAAWVSRATVPRWLLRQATTTWTGRRAVTPAPTHRGVLPLCTKGACGGCCRCADACPILRNTHNAHSAGGRCAQQASPWPLCGVPPLTCTTTPWQSGCFGNARHPYDHPHRTTHCTTLHCRPVGGCQPFVQLCRGHCSFRSAADLDHKVTTVSMPACEISLRIIPCSFFLCSFLRIVSPIPSYFANSDGWWWWWLLQ